MSDLKKCPLMVETLVILQYLGNIPEGDDWDEMIRAIRADDVGAIERLKRRIDGKDGETDAL